MALHTEEGHIREVFTGVFESLGADLLRACLNPTAPPAPNLIIMDEVGFLEKDAPDFQAAVRACLAANLPVWGVIKLHGKPPSGTASVGGRMLLYIGWQ